MGTDRMKSLLQKDFRYTPAAESTVERLRRVFAQERRRLKDEAARQAQERAEVAAKVRKMERKS